MKNVKYELWVVEVKFSKVRDWEPTYNVAFSKSTAKDHMADEGRKFPQFEYRVCCYQRKGNK